MVQLHPNYLEHDGKKAFVVLPYVEFLTLEEEMQCFEDLKALRSAKADEVNAPTMVLSQAREELGL